MEAKDTVMSDEQICTVAKPYADGGFWVVDYDRAIAKAQAEITFKLGEEEGRGLERKGIISFLKGTKHCWKNEDEKERLILALEDN